MVERRRFLRESDFREFFEAPERRLFRSRKVSIEPVWGAARAAEVVLAKYGFCLFHNGGLPLLERTEGSIRLEVLLPHRFVHSHGGWWMTGRIHLSHRGLCDVRRRYCRGQRACMSLAVGNVGELDLDPSWVGWKVGDPVETGLAIGHWVEELVLPWYDVLRHPSSLLQALFDFELALVSPIDSLEWVLAEWGHRHARRFYRRLAARADWPAYVQRNARRLADLDRAFRLSSRIWDWDPEESEAPTSDL